MSEQGPFRSGPGVGATGRPPFWSRQLKDAQPLQLLKGETWCRGFERWSSQYTNKHLLTGSFKPVVHIILFVGAVGYSIDYFTRNEFHSKWKNH